MRCASCRARCPSTGVRGMLPCTFPARDFSRVLLCVPLQEVQCGTHIYTHTQPCSVACVIGAHSTRTQLGLLLAPSSESCVWAIASACVFERSCAEVQCGTHIYTHTQPCSVACVIGVLTLVYTEYIYFQSSLICRTTMDYILAHNPRVWSHYTLLVCVHRPGSFIALTVRLAL